MPFHTLRPEFNVREFVSYVLDYLLQHPLALAVVTTAAFIVLYACCEGIGFVLAKRESRQNIANGRAEVAKQAEEQQRALLETRARGLGAVVNMSSRRGGQ